MQDQVLSSPDRSASIKTLSAISYISILPAAIMLFIPAIMRNPRLRFHVCQSILINLALMTAGFFLHLRGTLDQLLDQGSGKQFDAVALVLCSAMWAFAVLRLAFGKQFRIPYLARIAEQQANGRLFQAFGKSSSKKPGFADAQPSLEDAVQLSR